MTVIFEFILLYFFAFVIIVVISGLTYIIFFKKYGEQINKSSENDVNKVKSRLKYCLNCGEKLDKKNACKACGAKY